jgi:hypothetical protein
MKRTKILLGFGTSLFLAILLVGCGTKNPAPPPAIETADLTQRIDTATAQAVHFLQGRQDKDGAWRSDVYGQFKDGDALTPLVVLALLSAPDSAQNQEACRRGSAYLANMARNGRIVFEPDGLSYPVYTAALAVLVLNHPSNQEHAKARDAWLTYLCERQLTEELGWKPEDREYGGWGFAHARPQKPNADQIRPPLTESNLSATTFALTALRAAGRDDLDPAVTKSLRFVQSCQNYREKPDEIFGSSDEDGGFFFVYDDPVRNKAGPAGKGRFRSYGSTTADGLRCLLACGLAPDRPRVLTAARWLENCFRADSHPGAFAPECEPMREAVYFYYCWSVAQALRDCHMNKLKTRDGDVRWPEALAEALLARQRDDGSWANPAGAVREDEPLVATPMALMTLSICRQALHRNR